MKKRRLFISLASFLLTISIFMAIPAKQVDAATISLGSTKSYVSNGSGSFSVKVSCSGSWTVSDNAGWVSVRKSGSYVYVNYDANTSFSSRSASVTIRSGLNTKRFSFTQYANSYSMSLTKATLSPVPGSSFSVNVSVSQGSRYVSSKPAWLTYSQSGNTFTFKATENTGGTRTGTVYFYVAGQSKSISVTQNAYSLTVSNDSNKTIKSYKNTYSHYVTATTGAWTCTSDSTSWLTVSKSGNYLYVTAYQNPYSYSRSGNITFKLGGITKTIKYTQEANDFTVSTGSATLSARGGHTSVKVTTSGDGFTYKCNADWLTAYSDNSTYISFGTEYNNTTGSKRSATITINDKHGRSKTIYVYQEAHGILTDVDKVTFDSSDSPKTIKVTCSYSQWDVKSNNDWISVQKGNDQVSITCKGNNGNERNGSIVISSGGVTKTISITQKEFILNLSKNRLNFEHEAGLCDEVTVYSCSAGFTANENVDWLDVKKYNGILYVCTTLPNLTDSQREGVITITSGNKSKNIIVKQKNIIPEFELYAITSVNHSSSEISFNGDITDGITVGPEKSEWQKGIKVSTNLSKTTCTVYNSDSNWNKLGNCSWISVEDHYCSGDYFFNIEETNSSSKRYAIAEVNAEGLIKTFKIIQEPCNLQLYHVYGEEKVLLNEESVVYIDKYYTLEEHVAVETEGCTLSARTDADWLTVNAGNSSVNFAASKYFNSTGEARTATVYVTAGGTTKSFKVSQEGIEFNISQNEVVFPASGNQNTEERIFITYDLNCELNLIEESTGFPVWLTVKKCDYSNMPKKMLVISVKENEDSAPREFTFEIKLSSGKESTINERRSITIYQDGKN